MNNWAGATVTRNIVTFNRNKTGVTDSCLGLRDITERTAAGVNGGINSHFKASKEAHCKPKFLFLG